MKISLENKDKVSGLLNVLLLKRGLSGESRESIKDFRKTHKSGFKGKVPMGLIKQHGLSVLVEEVKKLARMEYINIFKKMKSECLVTLC